MDADAAGVRPGGGQMLGAGLWNVKWGGGSGGMDTNRYNIHNHFPSLAAQTRHHEYDQAPTSDLPVISDDGRSWCVIIIIIIIIGPDNK